MRKFDWWRLDGAFLLGAEGARSLLRIQIQNIAPKPLQGQGHWLEVVIQDEFGGRSWSSKLLFHRVGMVEPGCPYWNSAFYG